MERNKLKDIPVALIEPNPDNPRIVFRQNELDQLLISINKYGVQVPITVYAKGEKYILIDGERRWRTSKRLNFKTIPAIIQEEPSELNNLLMMFNIHSLREQWDLFTIANKITKVIELIQENRGISPNEIQISEETGLSRSTIRRCKLLIELPQRYKTIILDELQKPKPKQKLTEDFFIEMEISLKRVRNNIPILLSNIDNVRDILIKKYQNGIIKNVLDFRYLAKLATSHKNVSFAISEAQKAIRLIFEDNNRSIEDVYNSTVSVLYEEKKLISTFNNVLFYIKNLNEDEKYDDDIIASLFSIKNEIENILKGYGK